MATQTLQHLSYPEPEVLYSLLMINGTDEQKFRKKPNKKMCTFCQYKKYNIGIFKPSAWYVLIAYNLLGYYSLVTISVFKYQPYCLTLTPKM